MASPERKFPSQKGSSSSGIIQQKDNESIPYVTPKQKLILVFCSIYERGGGQKQKKETLKIVTDYHGVDTMCRG